MYHDSQGREIEDAEMDNMRDDYEPQVMSARQLQQKAGSIRFEYSDDDSMLQLLALQVWANIAVSLEHLVEYTYSIDKSLGSINQSIVREFDR